MLAFRNKMDEQACKPSTVKIWGKQGTYIYIDMPP